MGRRALQAQTSSSQKPLVAQRVDFNRSFLMGQAREIDLGLFSMGNPVMAGIYRADIYVNGRWTGLRELDFRSSGDSHAEACITLAMLEELGVDTPGLPGVAGGPNDCRPIDQWIPDAYALFDVGNLRLDVSIPQLYLRRTARGYVNPALWDRGVNAGFVNYNFNWLRSDMELFNGSQSSSNGYLGLNSGFNWNGWQFRHDSSYSWHSRSGQQWQNIATYTQRGLPQWRSMLTLGDAYTSGELFDSIGFRGVAIATDDRMLPDSLRGYAPIIRGIAHSNARVEVHQNNQLIYSTSVAPGAFVIDDLYPTGYGGDLLVRVTEADGRQSQFSVPYSSVTQMLRPGSVRYSLTLGKVRSEALQYEPYMMQATYQHGLNNLLTGYAGTTASEHYVSGLVGAGVSTPLGAFALDLTVARTDLRGKISTGSSVRLSHSKLLSKTGTNFTLAAYRYSDVGFYSLQDALTALGDERNGLDARAIRQRSQVQLTINQPLGRSLGSFYVTGSSRHYWNQSGSAIQYQAGYSNHYRSVNYGVSVQRSQTPGVRSDTQALFTISIPLGGARATTVASEIGLRNGRYDSSRASMTSATGEDYSFTYGLAISDTRMGNASLDANAQYRSRYSSLSANYSHGENYRQLGLGASGSAVFHGGGVTLAPQRGDTMVIVEAPGATDARVANIPGLKLDGRGYAVIPYVSPYRLNLITLDPEGMSPDVELESTSQLIAPYAGAIAKLTFATRQGRALLITARRRGEQTLPFGAQVFDAEGQAVGLVSQASRVYVRTSAEEGRLLVKWGEDVSQRCRIDYRIPTESPHRKESTQMTMLEAPCE